ncbi:MAG: 4-hydroxybenzoate octaprenyltransferase [Alphaproteobacteria bacterium]|nr:4-hydroxybenzoate octaprenyltransferase [Alphaproteobacteria bacterium]
MSTNSQASPADAIPQHWVEHLPAWLKPFAQLMRLDRPIGIWLLFWPCVLGLVLGATSEDRLFTSWRDFGFLLLFGLGAIVMRGAGCTFNDIVDRNYDAAVARTRGRPIPSGAVNVQAAAIFLLLLCLAGLLILLQLNRFAIVLGAASLLLVAAYPFMKRITWWPQAWLGLTFNWGALLGFAAETGRLDWPVFILYSGLIFWTLGYDTIYALQDRDDDELIGVKSTARLFGAHAKVWVGGFYVIAFALMLASGYAAHAGWLFTPLMLLVGAQLYWQVKRLDIADGINALMLFRSNRKVGGLMALAFLAANWFV